jgi:hypothetical protein
MLPDMVISPIIGNIGLKGEVVFGFASKNMISRLRKMVTNAKRKTPEHKARWIIWSVFSLVFIVDL